MLETKYQPAEIEARIHKEWEKAEAFKAGRPERKDAKPYTIVIPPPNVTGSLHMGHALNNTLQDILCRFERMRGRDVLWQPGTDHAGIATQMVVERQLADSRRPGSNAQTRQEMGREAFIERVWQWKAESGGTIINQLKRLGASCDWSRERFTMDEGLSRAVLKVFVELYNKKLIYKDKRLVNWDPQFQSALSELEVEQVEHKGSFKWADTDKAKDGTPVALNLAALGKTLDRDPNGHMYYFRYPLAGAAFDKDDPATFIRVATTRPETMLGDTAVAVHPDHPKYGAWAKKKVALPLTGRTIPIIHDDYADPEKGTGAVKITPAHDFNDFEVGRRHAKQLVAPINIFDAEAKLNDAVPQTYRGLDRFEARKRIIADLHVLGLVEKIEPHSHTVPHAQRGNAVIEPWLTDQWYVDAKTLAKAAIKAVDTGKTRFVPENWKKTYDEWMHNITPWCISRQIWWGHQIPAWYGPNLQRPLDHPHLNERMTFVAHSEAEVTAKAEEYYGRPVRFIAEKQEFEAALERFVLNYGGDPGPTPLFRDPDVLDTWFSSALWPFSTLGWPDETPELKRYYPTDVLVTGFDIIFFWVARMMMMGMQFQKKVPFHTVYIHALVRDEKGQKMSKSKGNVMDPLDIIDEYGADALRFTLAAMAAMGRDIKLATSRVEGYRNFATKLWNATRFAQVNGCARTEGFNPKKVKGTVNKWIVGETERTAKAVTDALEAYKFNEAAGAIYAFTWDVVCDWYIELSKPVLTGPDGKDKDETRACVAWVLDQVTLMLHPFMPFITEELWAKTGESGPARASLLALSQWPNLKGLANADADEEIQWIIRLVSEIRSLRTEMNVPGGAKIDAVLVGASAETRKRAGRHEEIIKRLARLENLAFADTAPKGSAQFVLAESTVALPLAGVIDLAAEASRLEKEIKRTEDEIGKTHAKLGNESFVSRAPAEVVEEMRERQAAFTAERQKLAAALERLKAAG